MQEKKIATPCSLDSLFPMAKRLKLTPMLNHIIELSEREESSGWSIAQWLDITMSAEIERRENSALKRRLQEAELDYADACYANIDWSADRHLNAMKINTVFGMDWINRHQHCLITGATGCGKTWLANAIAHEACMKGFKVKAFRLPTLLREFARFRTVTSVDDFQFKFLRDLNKYDLLLLDDWAIGVLEPAYRTGLYEIINHCSGHTSFLITSVPPVASWAGFIGDLTLADSILDRIVPQSIRLEMQGDSLRAKKEYGGIPPEENEDEKSC